MPELAYEIDIDAPPAEVIDLVGDFCLLSDFHPQIASCDVTGDGVGATRTLTLGDASTIVERLVEDLPDGYTYEKVEGQDAMTAYRASIRIVPRGEGSTVRWTAHVEVEAGRNADRVVERLLGLCEEGFASAKRFLEG